ncbi:hypothetical protein CR203_19215 [Salipaludibacillus neizhouensis]|uniref:histidine kinase n=1 Tax=Salipaludibacillus neizhouensis TaxID=885475 RepID=A0A3A9JZ66_9BACI|nr:sensor histidine kinase [Salipaludibacillus neizhouensis]RKL65777.1 hypothetical protein CR203_19215 [Salipaludibacillus neizhouensis]
MKLFFRDHVSFCCLYVGQLLLILMIFWLDGYRHGPTALYASSLSLILFGCYLVVRYIRNQTFYKRLSTPLTSLNDLSMERQASPLPSYLDQFHDELRQYYLKEMESYKLKFDHHIQFLNQWVHQMKTPLSVMHLMAQERDDEFSSSLNDEIERMKNGLDIVLYTSRLDSFENDFCVESLSLYSLIRKTTSVQKRLFIRNHIYPEIMIDSKLYIHSDEKWISFVFTQLITNAIKYTVCAGQKIQFEAKQLKDEIVVSIRDYGVGVPKSDLPRVFDPYFTGENGRSFQESTGMGLFLVKQIIDELGHRIEIESNLNQGTIVQIYFKRVN